MGRVFLWASHEFLPPTHKHAGVLLQSPSSSSSRPPLTLARSGDLEWDSSRPQLVPSAVGKETPLYSD
jgi:hypothetical protein